MKKLLFILTFLSVLASPIWAQTATILFKEQADSEADLETLLADVSDVITNLDTPGGVLAGGSFPSPTGLAADAVDALTEIAQGIKTAANDTDPLAVFTGGNPAGNRCVEINSSGQLLSAADTCANLGPGGTPSLDQITDPVGDAAFTVDAGEEISFSYTGAFTTGNQFAIAQLTGNPTGGILFDVRAADADVEVARFGDGTNGISISQAGVLSAIGTGSVVAADYVPLAGGVTLTGVLTHTDRNSDVANPANGTHVCWQSDGTGSGADGDLLCKITDSLGTTKFYTAADFSAI